MSRPLVVGWCGPSDGPWGWIQSQFANIHLLGIRDIPDWMTPQPFAAANNDRLLLVAMENRCDVEALSFIEQTSATGNAPPRSSKSKRTTKVPIAMLLGNDWHGHRRTYPTIPEGLPSFYWYQWYDRIFPWVHEFRSCDVDGAPTASSDSIAPRVRWMLDRSRWQSSLLRCQDGDDRRSRNSGLAWILTDHADQRELWRDACAGVGLRVVSSHLMRDLPWFEPDLIVVDCVSRSDESDQAIELAVRTARLQHPQAHLALVSPFPTWDRWLAWQNVGVDSILPRPSTLQGFLVYWLAWQS